MTTTVTNSTFSTTYRDDFADSDNYHRVLFNAGRALQARELTQMQTIIQREIARFARNIFNEGATVTPGGITVNNRYEFIKLDTLDYGLPGDESSLVGQEFTVLPPAGAIKFKVIQVVRAVGNDPATLYVRYTDTQAATSGPTAPRVLEGTLFQSTGNVTLKASSRNATGTGTVASIAQGDFFTQNHFVYAAQQTIFISKYSSTPTVEVGFKVVEEIITPDDEQSLYDNQGASPNIASPGADRYRIRLVLTTKDQIDSDENFVFVATITNGLVTKSSNGASDYNKINQLLAQRTKEESGDYIVKNFSIQVQEKDDNNLKLDVGGGTAYVDGYRLDIAPTIIDLPKATTELNQTDEFIIAEYGNYVLLDETSNTGLPDLNTFEQLTLYDTLNGTGTSMGTAFYRGVEYKKGRFYALLFAIAMDTGKSFRDVLSASNGSEILNFAQTSGITQLENTSNNSLLFSLPSTRPVNDGISSISVTVQKQYDINNLIGTSKQISAGAGFTFTNANDWVLTQTDGDIDATTSAATINLDGTPTGSSVTISNLTGGNDYTVLAYVADSAEIRTKQLSSDQVLTKAWPADAESDGNGTIYFDMGVADVYKVNKIRLDDSDGMDLSNYFIVDNGQRDNYYGLARLIRKNNYNVPQGNVYIKYDYFVPQSGDVFCVNSYVGIPYDEIPTYTKADGTTINLRDVLDFRPVMSSNGTFTSSNVNRLPQNTGLITADVRYFLPRKDQLIVRSFDKEGDLGVGELLINSGTPSQTPTTPETPTGSLAIANLILNAGTLNDSDMDVYPISHKRYTMSDIARLDRKLERLGEITSLSLLETETVNYIELDSDGLIRTKSGFTADNFKDFSFTAVDDFDYRASIDRSTKLLNPSYFIQNVRLTYDSDNLSQELQRSGDILTLPYTSAVFSFQDQATETINVNPFEVIINTGALTLSPSSDEWIETDYTPDIFVSGGTRKRIVGSRTITTRSWSGWFGVALAASTLFTGGATALLGSWASTAATWGEVLLGQVLTPALSSAVFNYGPVAAKLFDANTSVSLTADEAYVGEHIELAQIGSRVVDVGSIPYMRSKKVYFKAQGLRPNTQHFAFFGGVDMSEWVRQENSFTRFSTARDDVYSTKQYKNATRHPNGKTTLISDANGTINGSLFIPATPSVKFRTGAKIFKLIDITVDNDDAATSLCQGIFTSAGVLQTVERTIKATRVIDVETIIRKKKSIFCLFDPIAQSFFVNQTENPNGIFITKIDGFFATKPDADGQPIQCQIRGVTNGIPESYPIPNGTAFLNPGQVNIPSNTNDITTIRNTPTTFEFEEPIYLSPGEEYAVVFIAETTDYTAYVAKTYEYIIGSTERKVNKQPTLGSLYKSQNGTTWTPDQERDLMVRIHRADFETNASGYLENANPGLIQLDIDPFTADSSSDIVTVYHPGHGFIKNDYVTISDYDSSLEVGGITMDKIGGRRQIINCDWSGYTVRADSDATSDGTGGGTVNATQQAMYNLFVPTLQTLIPNNTAIDASVITARGASWAGDRNEATSNAYARSSYQSIVLNEVIRTEEPKLIPSAYNQGVKIGQNAVDMRLNLTTSDTKVSPIIDLQRASMTCIENSIDRQDSLNTDGFNIPLNYINETTVQGGSAASKHISVPVTIPSTAVGLKILMTALVPPEAYLSLYYRVSADDVDITDLPWIEATSEIDVPKDEYSFREYNYLIGGTTGTLNAFTSFQYKVVMESENTSKIPYIKNIRTIALAT